MSHRERPYRSCRKLLRLVLLGLVLPLLTHCAESAPQPEAELSVVLPRDALELDPRFIGDPYGIKVSRLIMASLVTINPRTLAIENDLAESVVVEDAQTYRVVLRPNLRFSDGTVLDAADVVATFESIVDPDLSSRYRGSFARLGRVEQIDTRTVRFHLSEPHATFLTDLEFPIMRSEDVGERQIQPLGAGPYAWEDRQPGRMRLTRNPHWHSGEAHFASVEMIVIRDDNTRALRMLAGSGDVAINAIPPLLVPMFEEDPGFEVRSTPGIGTTYLGINLDSPDLSDLRVRRAIAHAVDRPALVTGKLNDRATLASGWIPPGHWAFTEEGVETYEFDPDRARRLLDEAGYVDPPGEAPRMSLVLRTSTDRFRVSVCRAIARMLLDVGIKISVRPSETSTLIADLGRGQFDLTFLQVPEVFEPHVLSWFFSSDRIPGAGAGANRWRLRNAELDRAFEAGRVESNLRSRQQIYAQVLRILSRELPVVPLWHEDVVQVSGPRAERIDVPRDGRFLTLAQ